jgi:hypothetical protein
MCTIFVFQKEKLNPGPEREKIGSTQASPVPSSPATPSAVLPNNKEASRCMYRNFLYVKRNFADCQWLLYVDVGISDVT